jgi:hypothetical protein
MHRCLLLQEQESGLLRDQQLVVTGLPAGGMIAAPGAEAIEELLTRAERHQERRCTGDQLADGDLA